MSGQTTFGLAAPAAIKWLLGFERDVYKAVQEFIEGRRDNNFVDVAGPPTPSDLLHYYEKKGQVVPLPCVRLTMSMVKNNLTGERGVQVICNDRDLAEIERWRQMAALQKSGRTIGRA